MRYLLYPFALTLLLTAAITGALLIGRAQPLPDRVAVLHLNDMCKLPCWIGITPGVTTLGEAEKLVQSVYKILLETEDVNSTYGLRDHLITGSFDVTLATNDFVDDSSQALISRIMLAPSNSNLMIGDLQSTLGAPEQIAFDDGFFGNVTMRYHAIKVASFFKDDLLSASIRQFTIANWSSDGDVISPIIWNGIGRYQYIPYWVIGP